MTKEMEHQIVVREEPDLSPDELWDFYVENNCCETRYDKETATSVLRKTDVIVTARDKGKLVGVARAVTDGLTAWIGELSIALSHQGPGATNGTGALAEDDAREVGKNLGTVLVDILLSHGVGFIDTGAYKTEVKTYESAGFVVKQDHVNVFIDKRPPWDGVG